MTDSLVSQAGQAAALRGRRKVAMLAFEGMGPFHLNGPLMVFGANGINPAPVEFAVFALTPGQIRTCSGFDLTIHHGLECMDAADAIIVSGWLSADEAVPTGLCEALRRASARGAQIVALGLGGFVLAAAGLLDNRTATMHWMHSAAFRQRFPHVRFEGHVLYCRDGHIWTSAGGTAAVDTCLLLLEELQGVNAANQMARWLAYGLPRLGRQGQVIARPVAHDESRQRMESLMEWLQENPQEAVSLESLAMRMNMTVRTLTRQFRGLTGMSIIQWRLGHQLAHVRELLETTRKPIDAIALEAGFGSTVSMRKHFRKAVGISPSGYRKRLRRA